MFMHFGIHHLHNNPPSSAPCVLTPTLLAVFLESKQIIQNITSLFGMGAVVGRISPQRLFAALFSISIDFAERKLHKVNRTMAEAWLMTSQCSYLARRRSSFRYRRFSPYVSQMAPHSSIFETHSPKTLRLR